MFSLYKPMPNVKYVTLGQASFKPQGHNFNRLEVYYWYIAPQMEHSFSFLKFYMKVSSP